MIFYSKNNIDLNTTALPPIVVESFLKYSHRFLWISRATRGSSSKSNKNRGWMKKLGTKSGIRPKLS